MRHLTIEGELCDLNTYINDERSSRYQAASIKKVETNRVASLARLQKLDPIPESVYPVAVHLMWYTKDLRKDVDNVVFAKKFILDGLVEAGVIAKDSRKYVAFVQDQGIEVDKHRPRVEVAIYPV